MYRIYEIISGRKVQKGGREETQRAALSALRRQLVEIAAQEHDGPHLDIIAKDGRQFAIEKE